MRRDAQISPCGHFRYWLSRTWEDGPYLVFVMLNPSTADANADDNTIRRCIGFAKGLGYGGLMVVNLFAYRSTKPISLITAGWPVGEDNDRCITWTVNGKNVICAWGAHARHNPVRVQQVMTILKANAASVSALELTKDGYPRHPLYVKGGVVPVAYQ